MYTYARTYIYIHVYYPLSIFCDLYAYVYPNYICINIYIYTRIYRVSGKKMVQESTPVILINLINSFGKKQQIFVIIIIINFIYCTPSFVNSYI